MNLVWFKDFKFAPPAAPLIDFNVANFKSTTLAHDAKSAKVLADALGVRAFV
jgi:phospholipase C